MRKLILVDRETDQVLVSMFRLTVLCEMLGKYGQESGSAVENNDFERVVQLQNILGGRVVKLRIEKQQINGWLRAKKGLAEFGDHKLLVAAIHTFVKFLKISFCVTQGSS